MRQLLAAGYAVAATSRKLAELTQAVSAAPDQFLPLYMELSSEAPVQHDVQHRQDVTSATDFAVEA